MGNKYGSSVRTYTARNLLWTMSGTAAYTPRVMAAPSDFTVVAASNLTPQIVQCQWPLEADWNRESKITVKRFGVFCNFADGLVLEQNNARFALYLEAKAYTVLTDTTPLSNGDFTAGDNFVKNVVDPSTFITAGDIIVNVNGAAKYPYYVGYTYGGGARIAISDYSENTHAGVPPFNLLPLSKLVPVVGKSKSYAVKVIDAFNFMYEAENFLDIVPSSAAEFVFLTARLDVAGAAIQMYTKTVDPQFNGLPVSFDVSVEVEVTTQ
jgi:hypothetical protein